MARSSFFRHFYREDIQILSKKKWLNQKKGKERQESGFMNAI